MIELIISGIGLGIVLSFVTGPVFFALIKTSLEDGFYAGVSLALGVAVSDLIYISASIYGSFLLAFQYEYAWQIGLLGSLVLFSIGVYYLTKSIKPNDYIVVKRHYLGCLLKGFLMSILNPGVLLYWVSVTSGVVSLVGKLRAADMIPFFGSILLTQLSTDILKAYYAGKLRNRITEKNLQWLNKIAGILMIIFALRLVYGLI